MAALLLFPLLSLGTDSQSSVCTDGPDVPQRASRAKGRRNRPNLTRFCAKTKLCAFHLRGLCKRGDSCTYAHESTEIQAAPDLSCTKLCPTVLKTGSCSNDACKFAHSTAELRRLAVDVDELETPLSPQRASAPCFQDADAGTHKAQPCPVSAKPDLTPVVQVTKELQTALHADAMTQSEMVLHLTGMFQALYARRPDIEASVAMPPEVLALTTAAQAWADVGFLVRMTPEEVIRRCRYETVLDALLHLPRPCVQKPSPCHDDCLPPTRPPSEEDSDTWSRCTTEEDSVSIGKLHGCVESDVDESWFLEGCEVRVRNTFIHVDEPGTVCARRRAHSAPSRPRQSR